MVGAAADRSGTGGTAFGFVILIAASAIVCGILLASRPVLTALLPHLGAALAGNPPLVDTLFNLLVFGSIVAVAAIAGPVMRERPFALGRRPGAQAAIGLAIGLGGIGASSGYAALAGTLVPGAGGGASPGLLVWGVAIVALQTVAEEVYFRGWLQPALGRRWGLAPALVATALAFAALHVAGGARGAVSLFNLFLGGIMFGLLAARGGGLAAAIGTHFAWNGVEQLGFGLDPNPGTGSFGSVHDWDLVGPAIWGGSDEGLNASLGMTFALLAIVVPLALLYWRPLFGGGAAKPAAV